MHADGACQVGKLPANVNPQHYNLMVSGVQEMAQEDGEKQQFSYVKELRSWFWMFMREYYQTLARQNAVTSAATVNQFILPAQAYAAEVVRQPLGVSTNTRGTKMMTQGAVARRRSAGITALSPRIIM